MKTAIHIDLDDLLSDEANQREILGHLLSEDAFLDSFVTLIATGMSNEGSHPAWLDRLREKLHVALGDEYHADAMRRVQAADKAREDEWSRRIELELRLADIDASQFIGLFRDEP